MKRGTFVGMSAFGLLMATGAHADVIGFVDFDGGSMNLSGTANVIDYDNATHLGDVFGRVTPFYLGGTGMPFDVADDSVANVSGSGPFAGDTLGLAGQNTTGFFAMNDADGAALGGLNNATWSFDISSAVSIDSIEIDIAALGDFEASSTDGFRIEAQIDGGGYQTIFLGRTNEDLFHTYRATDEGLNFSDDDPLELFIDGSADAHGVLDRADATTGDFDTYMSTLYAGASGSSLDIRISWEGSPSGSEPMGFDNFTINGTIPAPGAIALLGLAGLASRRRRRA